MKTAAVTVLLFACSACHDDAPKSDVKLTLAGGETQLRYGKAFPHEEGLAVELSSHELTCDRDKKPEGETASIHLVLPPGPGGRFYAGAPAAYSLLMSRGDGRLVSRSFQRTAAIEPFEAKAGGRIRGKVDVELDDPSGKAAAQGAFDVEICETKPETGTPQKVEAPAGNVTGTLAGKQVTFHSAIVNVATDKASGKQYVDSLVLSARPRLFCNNALGVAGDVFVGSIGGLDATDSPVPADVSIHGEGGKSTALLGRLRPAWVSAKALDLAPGAIVEGAVVADSGPAVKPENSGEIGGHFKAKVCPINRGLDDVAASSKVVVSVNGKKTTLQYGYARPELGGIKVLLLDTKELGLGWSAPTGKGVTNVEVLIVPGPDARFYAGQQAGVRPEIWSPALKGKWPSIHLWRDQATVEMKPVTLEDYARVRGKLRASFKYRDPSDDDAPIQPIDIDGDFDVELRIEDPKALEAFNTLPDKAPDGPVAGSALGTSFSAKTVLASVAHEGANGTDVIWAIRFYENPAARCLNSDKPSFDLTFPGGSGSGAPILGKPQPVNAELHTESGNLDFGVRGEGAWVRFDTLAFKPGEKFRGAVIARDGSKTRVTIGGTFEATVCPPPPQ